MTHDLYSKEPSSGIQGVTDVRYVDHGVWVTSIDGRRRFYPYTSIYWIAERP